MNRRKTSLKKNRSPPNHRPRKLKQPSRFAELTVSVDTQSARIARTIRDSLEPETRAVRGFRSKTIISSSGRKLRLRIEAEDLVALRAASNSFLRFVAVSLKAIESVAPFYSGRLGSEEKA